MIFWELHHVHSLSLFSFRSRNDEQIVWVYVKFNIWFRFLNWMMTCAKEVNYFFLESVFVESKWKLTSAYTNFYLVKMFNICSVNMSLWAGRLFQNKLTQTWWLTLPPPKTSLRLCFLLSAWVHGYENMHTLHINILVVLEFAQTV